MRRQKGPDLTYGGLLESKRQKARRNQEIWEQDEQRGDSIDKESRRRIKNIDERRGHDLELANCLFFKYSLPYQWLIILLLQSANTDGFVF